MAMIENYDDIDLGIVSIVIIVIIVCVIGLAAISYGVPIGDLAVAAALPSAAISTIAGLARGREKKNGNGNGNGA